MEFHGNKEELLCSDFLILEIYQTIIQNEKVLLELQLTEKEKATLSIVTVFFSNAAGFLISIT